jgi:hypothetical protein
MAKSWFLIVYMLVAIVLMWFGAGLIRRPETLSRYLIKMAATGERPKLLLRLLRYFLMFTALSLILSLVPFSVANLMFSLGCLTLVFVFGRMLLLWDEVRTMLPDKQDSLNRLIRRSGVLMLLLSVLSLSLWIVQVGQFNVF